MTMLYTDPLFLKHETGQHPERPARLTSITTRLEQKGLIKQCTLGTYQPVTAETVSKLHKPSVVNSAKQLAEHGGGYLDADTVVCPDSYTVALAAAGVCVSAVDAVLAGKSKNALCLVRPPGHHATIAHSMGFCLFNNIALAAQHAKTKHGLSKILIVDFDVHHGNGTQDIFYEDPEVMFFSIHRYGNGFYPGTGKDSETGRGKGLGYTINAPIRKGTPRKEYRERYTDALTKAADKIKPELVMVSAGFDAHAKDPIGSLDLEVEDFTELTRLALQVARTHAGGRLVSCLEGGYNLEMLAESVEAHLKELLAE